jgi:hypothetical protein
MIRLKGQELQAERPTVVACGLDDLVEGNRSVYSGVSAPQPIQVWAMNKQHAHETRLAFTASHQPNPDV